MIITGFLSHLSETLPQNNNPASAEPKNATKLIIIIGKGIWRISGISFINFSKIGII